MGSQACLGRSENSVLDLSGVRCHLEISVGYMSLRGREGVWNDDLDFRDVSIQVLEVC